MKHFYPDNLEAPAMLAVWKIPDAIIIFFWGILSIIFALSRLSLIPLVPVAMFTVMTITVNNGATILTVLVTMGRYLISQQQIYHWREDS